MHFGPFLHFFFQLGAEIDNGDSRDGRVILSRSRFFFFLLCSRFSGVSPVCQGWPWVGAGVFWMCLNFPFLSSSSCQIGVIDWEAPSLFWLPLWLMPLVLHRQRFALKWQQYMYEGDFCRTSSLLLWSVLRGTHSEAIIWPVHFPVSFHAVLFFCLLRPWFSPQKPGFCIFTFFFYCSRWWRGEALPDLYLSSSFLQSLVYYKVSVFLHQEISSWVLYCYDTSSLIRLPIFFWLVLSFFCCSLPRKRGWTKTGLFFPYRNKFKQASQVWLFFVFFFPFHPFFPPLPHLCFFLCLLGLTAPKMTLVEK